MSHLSPIQDAVTQVQQFSAAAHAELRALLAWWRQYTPDPDKGGFYGAVGNDNLPVPDADKGLVLNCRILWTFSTAAIMDETGAAEMAHRAFSYLHSHFTDPETGGLWWSVDANGYAKNTRKQVYGQAFGIYGMAAYYRCCGNPDALRQAQGLYRLLVQHAFDPVHGGFWEALDRQWQPLEDMRLSEKDANDPKTTNTHLHLAEAFAELYRVWPDEALHNHIIQLLQLFQKHIIHPDTGHLQLFFDRSWNCRSGLISYGHDIEAAWLLQQCAEMAGDHEQIANFRRLAIDLTRAAMSGLDADGGLWYEYEQAQDHLVREKHSWPQAEAMIGFMNAFQLTGDTGYLDHAWQSFEFTQRRIKDKQHGEWYWGVDNQGRPMIREKAGFWKCPYHSTRACMEIIGRAATISPQPAGLQQVK